MDLVRGVGLLAGGLLGGWFLRGWARAAALKGWWIRPEGLGAVAHVGDVTRSFTTMQEAEAWVAGHGVPLMPTAYTDAQVRGMKEAAEAAPDFSTRDAAGEERARMERAKALLPNAEKKRRDDG